MAEAVNISKLARQCNVSTSTVYYVAKKLGRLPTEEELKTKSYVSRAGRKPKYFQN